MTQVDLLDCIVAAEEAGFDSVWVAEGQGGDAFAILAAAAMKTRRIRLATGIVSVFVRSAPTIALAAATVTNLSGGRFVLGLGTSHDVQVVGQHGLEFGAARERLGDTIQILRTLEEYGRLDKYRGLHYVIDEFEFGFPVPTWRTPVYVAALTTSSINYAATVSQGVLLTFQTTDSVAAASGLLRRSLAMTGRRTVLASLLACSIGSDPEEAHIPVRRLLAYYCGFFPRYNRLFALAGYESQAIRIAAAWASGDHEGAQAQVPDGMVDAFTVSGTVEYCARRVRQYRDAGLELPILVPTATGSDPKRDVIAVINAFSP